MDAVAAVAIKSAAPTVREEDSEKQNTASETSDREKRKAGRERQESEILGRAQIKEREVEIKRRYEESQAESDKQQQTVQAPRMNSALSSMLSPRKRRVKSLSDMNLTPVKQQEVALQQQYLIELHRQFNQKKGALRGNVEKIEQIKRSLTSVKETIEQRQKEEAVMESNGVMSHQQNSAVAVLEDKIAEMRQARRMHDFMAARLSKTKVEHDKQVAEIQKANAELVKELTTYNIRLREAANATKLLDIELQTAKKRATDELQDWMDRLEDRREIMAETSEVLQYREKQAAQQIAIVAEVKGDLDAEGEQRLQRKVVANKLKQMRLANDIAKRSEGIEEYDKAFKRIQETTGINSVEQMVEKFLGQKDTMEDLNEMIEEANSKIAQLVEEKNESRKEAEQIRFQGIVQTSKQRKMVDEREAAIETCAKVNKRLSERTNFLKQVLRGIKDGILHVSSQLDSMSIPGITQRLLSDQSGGDPSGQQAASVNGESGEGGEKGGLGNAVVGTNDKSAHSANAKAGGSSDIAMVGGADSGRNDSADDSEGNGNGNTNSNSNSNSNSNNNSGGNVGLGVLEMGHNADREAADWYTHALTACEHRILKVLDALPSKIIHIDDMDQNLVSRYNRAKIMIKVDKDDEEFEAGVPSACAGEASKTPFARKMNALNSLRSVTLSPSKRLSNMLATKGVATCESLKEEMKRLQASASSAAAAHSKAKLELQDLQAASKSQGSGKNRLSGDAILSKQGKVAKTKTAAEESQRNIKALQAKIDAAEAEVARLAAGDLPEGAKLQGLGGSLNDADSDTSSQDEHDERLLDDFEANIPVLGDKKGREAIKRENLRIVQFAEKKRNKITKSFSLQEEQAMSTMTPAFFGGGRASISNPEIEEQVQKAARAELRRMTVLNTNQSRISYIRKQSGKNFDEGKIDGSHGNKSPDAAISGLNMLSSDKGTGFTRPDSKISPAFRRRA